MPGAGGRSPNASRQTGAWDLRASLREALPLEPQVSRVHSRTRASPHPRALLCRTSTLLGTSPLPRSRNPKLSEEEQQKFSC